MLQLQRALDTEFITIGALLVLSVIAMVLSFACAYFSWFSPSGEKLMRQLKKHTWKNK